MLDTRAARREATRERILKAAWRQARRDGIALISLREIGKAVGMRAPSLYSYFDSKFALYDAMFAEGNRELLDAIDTTTLRGTFEERTKELIQRFFQFCAANPERHQLMFQRPVPGFEPSPESYELAVQMYERMRAHFAEGGITDQRLLDLWTGITGGVINQQVANDPGGDRWARLLDDVVDMFLAYARKGRQR